MRATGTKGPKRRARYPKRAKKRTAGPRHTGQGGPEASTPVAAEAVARGGAQKEGEKGQG
ncbi:hypothetical protein YIM73052_10140 [Thermus antranikianii]